MGKKVRNVYDAIVADALQKSVVTAPSDPNGGARLPERQSRQPRNKDRDGENYMAIFDREAQESDDQLDDWMRYTQAVTESPEDFVNDDDDTPEDPDEADEDSRGNAEYDPYSDDDADDAAADLTDEEYTHVKAHKRRRVRKSQGDHDAEFDALSDDAEDEDDPEDNLEEDDAAERRAKNVAKATKTRKSVKKSRSDDDDDLDEDDDDPDHNMEDEDEDDTHVAENKAERKRLEKSRRRSMKKALGRDALGIVDGNAFAKALADAVWDLRDDVVAEVRATNLKLHKENQALAQRVRAVEGRLHKALQGELQQVTKSLASGLVSMQQPAALADDPAQPIRKGYGAPVATRPKYSAGWNPERALDAMEKAWREDPESGIKDTDLTLVEGNRSPNGLSAGAIRFLRANRLL
ncbi:hypothetical protein [Sulfobacillus harzensis]|uniref:Uncharacterized protein n=1 Tax=Sulfobacillus harzensis TaxID=2729629 RepID=A0A7Y0L1T1_9FIRM|nr:hypothetical protein [Sulfobacillus harzensis]NMP20760.1 hypothetical protein [Sulfobacillus harzensis]